MLQTGHRVYQWKSVSVTAVSRPMTGVQKKRLKAMTWPNMSPDVNLTSLGYFKGKGRATQPIQQRAAGRMSLKNEGMAEHLSRKVSSITRRIESHQKIKVDK